MDPLRLLPDTFLERARTLIDGDVTPVEARHASTIVLTRDGSSPASGGVEVYLLRRHGQMAFAGGMAVFPGGGVDARDFDADVAWSGPSAAEWAGQLDCDEDLARALVCAAVRETFEESGVLFAGPTADTLVGDTSGDGWEADRAALEARELAFTDFLSQRGLTLRTDLLRLWGTWITPAFEPRRYNTRFFVAALPPGQETRDVSGESESVEWMSVATAIEAVDKEQLMMLPPQYVTCMELYAATSATEVLDLADARDVTPFEPRLVIEGDTPAMTSPAHVAALYDEIHLTADRVERATEVIE